MTTGEQIFEQLIGPIRDRMIRTVGSIVQDPHDAADTLQNVLMTVWTEIDRIHRAPNPQAYVLRICINAAYGTLRQQAREGRGRVDLDVAAMLPSGAPGPAATAVAQDVRAAVVRAIADLPAQQAQAVFLRLVDDEPFDMIARVLDCDERTARSHVSKGKARLRELLTPVLDKEML